VADLPVERRNRRGVDAHAALTRVVQRVADHRSGAEPVATGDESIAATSATSSTRSPPTRQHPLRRSRRQRLAKPRELGADIPLIQV